MCRRGDRRGLEPEELVVLLVLDRRSNILGRVAAMMSDYRNAADLNIPIQMCKNDRLRVSGVEVCAADGGWNPSLGHSSVSAGGLYISSPLVDVEKGRGEGWEQRNARNKHGESKVFHSLGCRFECCNSFKETTSGPWVGGCGWANSRIQAGWIISRGGAYRVAGGPGPMSWKQGVSRFGTGWTALCTYVDRQEQERRNNPDLDVVDPETKNR
jgi:hypothetical protein